MFISLLFLQSQTNRPADIFPPECQSNIEYYNYQTLTLEANTKYCFSRCRTLAINGESVKISIYYNKEKKGEGVGIFASSKYIESLDEPIVFMLESEKTQKVTLIDPGFSIDNDITSGDYYYLTTNNTVKDFDLDSIKSKQIYILGPKKNLKLTFDLVGNLIIMTDRGRYKNEETSKKTVDYGDVGALEVQGEDMFLDHSSDFKAIISYTSEGEDWVTPVNGLLNFKEFSVYSVNDLKTEDGIGNDKLSLYIGVGVAAFVVIIIIVIIYCCCCKKKKKNHRHRSSSSYSD